MTQDIYKHPRSRRTAKERRRRQQGAAGPSRTLIILGIAGLALAFVGVLIISSPQNPFAPAATVVAITPFPRPAAQQNAMGDPNAPVKIDEYSDFQCPFCARFHAETYKALKREFVETGVVRMAYLHLPLGQHEHAGPAAEAAMCASVQGRFWPVHDAIFETQKRWTPMSAAQAVVASSTHTR